MGRKEKTILVTIIANVILNICYNNRQCHSDYSAVFPGKYLRKHWPSSKRVAFLYRRVCDECRVYRPNGDAIRRKENQRGFKEG